MKLVILDRDGVINYDSKQFIKSPAEWRPIPGSIEAIAKLSQAGYRVVLATNQSGIGRGLFDMDTLNAIHDKMHRAVQAAGGRIDAIFYCPHPVSYTHLDVYKRQVLDSGGVDTVVLGMRADEANKHQPLCIAHSNDQTEVVTLEIEDCPIVRQETGVALGSLDVGRRFPIGIADFSVPSP